METDEDGDVTAKIELSSKTSKAIQYICAGKDCNLSIYLLKIFSSFLSIFFISGELMRVFLHNGGSRAHSTP